MEDQAVQNSTTQIEWTHLRMLPFPQIALQVLELVNNQNVQRKMLGELISSDSAFASKVITVVNSALYPPRYPLRSIRQAIEVLSASHLQGLCLTVE